MQKGLGIAALVVGIIAISVPVIGPWLTILVAVLAAFAYGPGFGFAIAAIIVDVVNILFLSPTVWMDTAMLSKDVAGGRGIGIAFIFLGSQIIAFVVLIVRNKKHNKQQIEAPVSEAT